VWRIKACSGSLSSKQLLYYFAVLLSFRRDHPDGLFPFLAYRVVLLTFSSLCEVAAADWVSFRDCICKRLGAGRRLAASFLVAGALAHRDRSGESGLQFR